jgi:hypothetical protein
MPTVKPVKKSFLTLTQNTLTKFNFQKKQKPPLDLPLNSALELEPYFSFGTFFEPVSCIEIKGMK